jgi:hypothetical protein
MKKELSGYKNPNDAITEFETELAKFTGATGVIATDSCSQAIELGLRYAKPKMYATIPPQVHFTVPMILKRLGIEYMVSEDNWEKEFRICGSNVYVAANTLEKDMFHLENPNQRKIVCLSFGPESPMRLGGGGAILTNDKKAYEWLKLAANNGRDATIDYWEDQKEFTVGYDYGMRPADAIAGLEKLANNEINNLDYGYENYPDISELKINT